MQSLGFFQLGLHRFSFYHFSVNNDIILVALNLLFFCFPTISKLYVCAVNHVFLIVKLQRNFGPNMEIFPVVAS